MSNVVKLKKEKKKYYSGYSMKNFFVKLVLFWFWNIVDLNRIRKHGRPFNEFGLTLMTGKQGSGKTMSLVEYLERMRVRYPKCLILTNFGYVNETQAFTDWRDFFEVRNEIPENGVIFAIDEIQNEFSSSAWKNFPENLLSEITQQRKQKIKIVGTSQVFTRVAKPLREQTYEVVECFTLFGRWTFTKSFDAKEYEHAIDSPNAKNKLHRLKRRNFIQDDKIRNLYDSYAKIERMAKTEFFSRYTSK
jgi:hypothetical protein